MNVRPVLTIAIFLSIASANLRAEYTDHRRKNLDSLENVVVKYTPDKIENATEEELEGLINAYDNLMNGYLQINRERSMLFARKQIALAAGKGWYVRKSDAEKTLGKHFWAMEQYDSAMFYYMKALRDVDKIAEIAADPDNPNGYSQTTADNSYSSLYGAIGNLYNMMDSIPQAMEYYRMAGKIFDRYGWNESNSILYHNIGETYLDLKDYPLALDNYERSLRYALASGDTLQISSAYTGLGALYLELGRTRKALKYLKEADNYYSIHEDQEFRSRIETLDLIGQVLSQQKKQLRTITLTAILLALLTIILAAALRKAWIFRRQRDAADEAIDEALGEEDDIAVSYKDSESVLTARESEILPLIAEGLTSQQIADKVFLSLATIKWHRKKLLEKFEAANTAELISKAKEKGFI